MAAFLLLALFLIPVSARTIDGEIARRAPPIRQPARRAAPRAARGSDTWGFDGPLHGHAIEGLNDLGDGSLSSPEECAKLCRANPRCRSFDWGVEWPAKGHCYLSTHNRTTANVTDLARFDYYEMKEFNILETLESMSQFELLVKAIRAAELEEELITSGNNKALTLFAPTNAAFQAYMTANSLTEAQLLARADLADILNFHIAWEAWPSSRLQEADVVPTFAMFGIEVTRDVQGNLELDGKKVISQPDVMARNGYIHEVNALLVLGEGAPTTPITMTMATEDFIGPFVDMAIRGWNDWYEKVTNVEECAKKCATFEWCRSFDFGARGTVVNECWLSKADRERAGRAYTEFRSYDYYERKRPSLLGKSAEQADLTDFATIVQDTALEATLNGPGPFSVFAPTNAVLKQLQQDMGDKEAVVSAIKSVVVLGRVETEELKNGKLLRNLAGDFLRVETRDGSLFVGGAKISKTGFDCSNGYLFAAEALADPIKAEVLEAPSKKIAETLRMSGFEVMAEALFATGLEQMLSGPKEYTVLAPTDEAFTALEVSLGLSREDLLHHEHLKDIISAHIIEGAMPVSSMMDKGSLVTIGSDELQVTATPGAPHVSLHQTTSIMAQVDWNCSNGIIHVVDRVLLPDVLEGVFRWIEAEDGSGEEPVTSTLASEAWVAQESPSTISFDVFLIVMVSLLVLVTGLVAAVAVLYARLRSIKKNLPTWSNEDSSAVVVGQPLECDVELGGAPPVSGVSLPMATWTPQQNWQDSKSLDQE